MDTEKLTKAIGVNAGLMAIGTTGGYLLGKAFKVDKKMYAWLILGGITVTYTVAILTDQIWNEKAFAKEVKENAVKELNEQK